MGDWSWGRISLAVVTFGGSEVVRAGYDGVRELTGAAELERQEERGRQLEAQRQAMIAERAAREGRITAIQNSPELQEIRQQALAYGTAMGLSEEEAKRYADEQARFEATAFEGVPADQRPGKIADSKREWQESVTAMNELRTEYIRERTEAGVSPDDARRQWQEYTRTNNLGANEVTPQQIRDRTTAERPRADAMAQLHQDFVAIETAKGTSPTQAEQRWQQYARDNNLLTMPTADLQQKSTELHTQREGVDNLRNAIRSNLESQGVNGAELETRTNADLAREMRENTTPAARETRTSELNTKAQERRDLNQAIERYADSAGLSDAQKQAMVRRINNLPEAERPTAAQMNERAREVETYRQEVIDTARSQGMNNNQAEAVWQQELQGNRALASGTMKAEDIKDRDAEQAVDRARGGAPGAPGAPGATAPGGPAPNAREDTLLRQAKDAAGRTANAPDQPPAPTREELLAEQRQLQQQLRQAGRGGMGGNPMGMNPLGLGANPMAATPHLAGMMPGGMGAGGMQSPAEIRERLNEINAELRRTPATATPSGPPFTGNVVAMGRTENGQAVVLTTDDQGRTRAYAYDERNQKIGAAVTRDQVITVTAVDASTENLNLMRGNRLQLTVGEVSGPAAPAAGPAGPAGPGGPGGGRGA